MKNVSVTVPFGQALTRAGTVLFQPFDLGKWFVIGFCAWLAYLCEGGGFHGGGHYGGGHRHGGRSARAQLEQAWDFVVNNIAWLAPLVIGLILVILGIGLVLLWLSSRGRFMFLHCVARNVGEVRVPWHKYAAEANSLFLFRVVISLVSMAVFVPLIGALALVILRMVFREAVTVGGVLGAIGLVLAMMVAGIGFWIVGRLTKDFIVPLQFLRHSRCLDAWRALRSLFAGNVAEVVLYLLFRILLGIGIGVALLALIVATCCIAGCLLAIPYIGTVLLLPVLVFERSYSLHYLAQYGPDYDVFSPPAGEASGVAI